MKRRIAPLKILFALFGKKPDVPLQPNALLDLAAERFIGSIQALGSSRQANLLALSSDLVYELNYQLDWWQKLFFPVLSCRLIGLQLQVCQDGLADYRLQVNLRRTVAQLEFGDKAPPGHLAQVVRQKILSHQFTNWRVRQAFNSKALKKSKDGLQIQHQPTLLSKTANVACWIFGILSSVLLIILLQDAFVAPTIRVPYAHFSFVIHSSVLATGFFFQIGKQWTNGATVMQEIWPADLVRL